MEALGDQIVRSHAFQSREATLFGDRRLRLLAAILATRCPYDDLSLLHNGPNRSGQQGRTPVARVDISLPPRGSRSAAEAKAPPTIC